jgi:hypothetical protein
VGEWVGCEGAFDGESVRSIEWARPHVRTDACNPHPAYKSDFYHSPIELREAQNEYESLSYALRALDEQEETATPEERAALEGRAKEARKALLAAAARLARVEEHAQVGRWADVSGVC